MQSNKVNAIFTVGAVIVFTVIGLLLTQANEVTLAASGTFADVLRSFGEDGKTRGILVAILIDLVTGVMAALRTNTFDAQRLAQFYRTNVIPYVLGYLLVWVLTFSGLAEVANAAVLSGVASFGFGTILSTLTASTIDNLRRAMAGTTPPHDVAEAVMLSELTNTPPQG